MAYKVEKINPLDLQPRKAVGVALPLSGRAVFNSTYQSKDAIKTNLINFFLTGTQERFLNPNFGAGIRQLLFDNVTESRLAQIKSSTLENIKLYFKRVQPIDFQIISEPDTLTISLYFKYQIRDSNIQDEITINFEQ
jgi:phage baseplate assembly protein W